MGFERECLMKNINFLREIYSIKGSRRHSNHNTVDVTHLNIIVQTLYR